MKFWKVCHCAMDGLVSFLVVWWAADDFLTRLGLQKLTAAVLVV